MTQHPIAASAPPMDELLAQRVRIRGGFWGDRLDMNASTAISHQWEQLQRAGCFDNFRIAARQADGFREGLFFADSDAYKWLDAASRILADYPDPGLRARVDELIMVLEAAQSEDGYLYTYNQILFPGRHWVNLQLEHEMYCLGHLIEAGISHHAATGEQRLLTLVRRSADLLVREFMDAGPDQLDGHEEIEIALIRLYRVTGERRYIKLARRFLDRRGRRRPFIALLLPQVVSTARRLWSVSRRRKAYRSRHPERADVRLPAINTPKIPRLTWMRLIGDTMSGRTFQQHAPLRQQNIPVGHAVRFTYLETAAAMLSRESEDLELRAVLEQAWEHMVRRRMYVTGGLGSLPLIEGFGRDYELDPEVAYAETCAAIGSLLWNSEMARLTGEPRYDDLYEWQLYNAAAVGMGLNGRSYLYNNPLTCRGNITRVPWYLIPCCPSNLSRTWASLGEQVCRVDAQGINLSQYITSEVELAWGLLKIDSGLPWSGAIRVTLEPHATHEMAIRMRLPAWSDTYDLKLNGVPIDPDGVSPGNVAETACGYAPHAARVLTLQRRWKRGDTLDLTLGMPIRLQRQDLRIAGCGGMDALTRGPLVYCLESIDNPENLFEATVQRNSLRPVEDNTLLGGIHKISGLSVAGAPLTFIPYMLWGNRGASQMTVFFRNATV